MKALLLTGLLSAPGFVGAQEKNLETPIEPPSAVALEKEIDTTLFRRTQNRYFVLLDYSPLDLILPPKTGLTMGFVRDASQSWELEWLRGSWGGTWLLKDLGGMTDDRISWIGRSYAERNSFNISYGISYFDYRIQLGNDLLKSVDPGYGGMDVVRIQSLGLNIGIGNRWIVKKNISWGIDWISLAQPLLSLKRDAAFMDHSNNQGDKNKVDEAMKVISYFPRWILFKLQLGISF